MTIDRKSIVEVEFKSAPGTFRAVFATLAPAIDLDGDVTEPGAFPNGTQVPISSYNHASSRSDALPVGKGVISSNSKEAWIDGTFFLGSQAGKDSYEVVKELGELGQWSYSYAVKAGSVIPAELDRYPGAKRILRSLSVFEVSPVLAGAAGPGRTRTDFIKAAAVDTEIQAELRTIKEQSELREMWFNHLLVGDMLSGLDHSIELKALEAREVSPAAIGEPQRRLAGQALFLACLDLDLKEQPRLRWFGGQPRPAGIAFKNRMEVWVNARYAGPELVQVVAHEVRHLAGGDEATALDYGRERAMAWPSN